jgi:hypothetical protein
VLLFISVKNKGIDLIPTTLSPLYSFLILTWNKVSLIILHLSKWNARRTCAPGKILIFIFDIYLNDFLKQCSDNLYCNEWIVSNLQPQKLNVIVVSLHFPQMATHVLPAPDNDNFPTVNLFYIFFYHCIVEILSSL